MNEVLCIGQGAEVAALVIGQCVSFGKEIRWRHPSSFQAFPWPRVPILRGAAIHRHSSEISVRDLRVIGHSAAAGRCQALARVRTLSHMCCGNFQRLRSSQVTALSNNALKRRRAKTHAP